MNETDYGDIAEAVRVLRRGGVILYPTDTVWGVGCDACDESAVAAVYRLKQRADSKALIVLVADKEMLARHIGVTVPRSVSDFMGAHPGRPVTVVYPKGHSVAPNLLAEDGSVGIRLVSEGFAHELCSAFGRPIVSTSANISGEPSARTFGEISSQVVNAADYVCTTGRTQAPGRPSMVVKLGEDGTITILRD